MSRISQLSMKTEEARVMMIAACDAGRDVLERWLDGRGGK